MMGAMRKISISIASIRVSGMLVDRFSKGAILGNAASKANFHRFPVLVSTRIRSGRNRL